MTGLGTRRRDGAKRIVGTVVDVTEAHRNEARLRENDRRKDAFLATLGHELRNPLGAIVNTVQRLRERTGEGHSRPALEIIARQANHMTGLLNDLLDIGRITRGEVQLRRSWTRLGELVTSAVQVLRPQIDAAGHALQVSIDPPDLELVVDPDRCEQILTNLLSNAIHYTPGPGKIALTARVVDDQVEIVITDTGVGLTEGERERAFDLFYQARRGSGGLGVGLNLVQTLVQLHGGTLELESPGLGHGTTVRVSLPRAVDPPAEDASQTQPDGKIDMSGMRVLLVDDEVDSLTSLGFLLGKRVQIETAATAATAVDKARTFRPHLLLLDLSLPDATGIDLAESILAIPGLEDAERIAITGFGDQATAQRLREAGFRAHVLKPVELETLLGLLAETCRDLGLAKG